MMKTRCQRPTMRTVRFLGTSSLIILLYSVSFLLSIFRNPDPVFQDLRLVVKAINAYLFDIPRVRFWIQKIISCKQTFQYDNTNHSFFSLLMSNSHLSFCTRIQVVLAAE
jgi:hypothetical protein